MRNLGPKSLAWLDRVGIRTTAELIAVGVVPTFLMVRQAGGSGSLNLLWALEGATQDIDWRAVSESRKRQLVAELESANREHSITDER